MFARHFLIPQNNSNAALNGLLIEASNEQLKLTATDGHCLAQVCSQQYRLDQAQTWLLPRRAVFELKKIIETGTDQEIFIGLCDNQLVFSGSAFNFYSISTGINYNFNKFRLNFFYQYRGGKKYTNYKDHWKNLNIVQKGFAHGVGMCLGINF